jgi:hypothetical protein
VTLAELRLAMHALGPHDTLRGGGIARRIFAAWAAREERLRKSYVDFRRRSDGTNAEAWAALAKEMEWEP